MPNAPLDYENWTLGRPNVDPPPDEFWPSDVEWGRGSRGNGRTRRVTEVYLTVAVALTSCRTDIADEAELEFNNATVAALTRWIDRVSEWLEIIARIDVQPDRPRADDRRYVRQAPLLLGLHTRRWLTNMTLPTIGSHGSCAASHGDWQRAVTLANAGVEPPEEHRFLRDSRAALRRGHLRRAIIDAGTASEIAMARAIREHLQQSSSGADHVDLVLRNTDGLVELYDLRAALGTALPVSRGTV